MVHGSEFSEGKLALFWLLGAITISIGVYMLGHIERTIGVTNLSYYASLLIAFLLVLFGGLAWIGVAVKVSHHNK